MQANTHTESERRTPTGHRTLVAQAIVFVQLQQLDRGAGGATGGVETVPHRFDGHARFLSGGDEP
jgi:hypothetical protein